MSATVEVPVTVRLVIVVVARVEVPVTANAPLIIWLPRKVVDPITAVSMYP
jgi:hypothetical protein